MMTPGTTDPDPMTPGAMTPAGRQADTAGPSERRAAVEAAIRQFFQEHADPALADVALRLLADTLAQRPELLAAYGPGIWADVCCRLAAICNFWLDRRTERLDWIHLIDDRWTGDNPRFEQLHFDVLEQLDAYPWNPAYLTHLPVSRRRLRTHFADCLLKAGVEDFEDADEMFAFQYGSVENAREHAFETFVRSMGFRQYFQDMLAAEDAAEPARRPLPDDDRSPAAQARAAAWLSRQPPPNTDGDDAGPADPADFPWLIRGRSTTGLSEALNALPTAALFGIAERHHCPADPETERPALIQTLCHLLPRRFLSDLECLDHEYLQLIMELCGMNGRLFAPGENDRCMPLILDGFLFAFQRKGGMRVYLPDEMIDMMAHFDFSGYERQYDANRRVWLLATAMANLYGVYMLPQLAETVQAFCPGDTGGYSSGDLRRRLRQLIAVLGRYDETFTYSRPYIHHVLLDCTQAEQFWAEAEQDQYPFRPLSPDLIEIYSDALFDAEDRLAQGLQTALEQAAHDMPDSLPQDIRELQVELAMDELTAGVVLEMPPEQLADAVAWIPDRHRGTVLTALLDFSDHTPHWLLRGRTPHDAGIDLKHLTQ